MKGLLSALPGTEEMRSASASPRPPDRREEGWLQNRPSKKTDRVPLKKGYSVCLLHSSEMAGSLSGVVVEITLDIDDGGTLIAGTGGQIAQRTDEIGQAAGRGALGGHLAH